MSKTKGFSALAIIIFLAILAGGGYWVWKGKTVASPPAAVTGTNIEPPAPSAPSTPSVDTADWKTYQNDKYGFEFKYPVSWEVRLSLSSVPSAYEREEFFDKNILMMSLSNTIPEVGGEGLLIKTEKINIVGSVKQFTKVTRVSENPNEPWALILVRWNDNRKDWEKSGELSIFGVQLDVSRLAIFDQILSTFRFTK